MLHQVNGDCESEDIIQCTNRFHEEDNLEMLS